MAIIKDKLKDLTLKLKGRQNVPTTSMEKMQKVQEAMKKVSASLKAQKE